VGASLGPVPKADDQSSQKENLEVIGHMNQVDVSRDRVTLIGQALPPVVQPFVGQLLARHESRLKFFHQKFEVQNGFVKVDPPLELRRKEKLPVSVVTTTTTQTSTTTQTVGERDQRSQLYVAVPLDQEMKISVSLSEGSAIARVRLHPVVYEYYEKEDVLKKSPVQIQSCQAIILRDGTKEVTDKEIQVWDTEKEQQSVNCWHTRPPIQFPFRTETQAQDAFRSYVKYECSPSSSVRQWTKGENIRSWSMYFSGESCDNHMESCGCKITLKGNSVYNSHIKVLGMSKELSLQFNEIAHALEAYVLLCCPSDEEFENYRSPFVNVDCHYNKDLLYTDPILGQGYKRGIDRQLTTYQYRKYPDLGQFSCIEVKGEEVTRYYSSESCLDKVVFLKKWEKGRLVDGKWVRGLDQASLVLEELDYDAEVSRVTSTTVVVDQGWKKDKEEG